MGFMTITKTEAYNSAIELLKGTSKDRLGIYPHTGGYTCPSKVRTSHEIENKGSKKNASSCRVPLTNLMKIRELKKDYKELQNFYDKPADQDTITSQEARELKKELARKIENYIKPEHRVYQDQIEKHKVVEEL